MPRFIRGPVSHPGLDLHSLFMMVGERMGILAGRLRKLGYDLDPSISSAMHYNYEIFAIPEPHSIASDLIRWGNRSIGHQRLLSNFKEFLSAASKSMDPIIQLMQEELREEISEGLVTPSFPYQEGLLVGLQRPPQTGVYPMVRAAKEARWAIQMWDVIGNMLTQHHQLRPIWEIWNDTLQVEEYAERLEDLFLTEVPAQQRLQPRDWLYY